MKYIIFLHKADHVVANVEGAIYEPSSLEGVSSFFHAMSELEKVKNYILTLL